MSLLGTIERISFSGHHALRPSEVRKVVFESGQLAICRTEFISNSASNTLITKSEGDACGLNGGAGQAEVPGAL